MYACIFNSVCTCRTWSRSRRDRVRRFVGPLGAESNAAELVRDAGSFPYTRGCGLPYGIVRSE